MKACIEGADDFVLLLGEAGALLCFTDYNDFINSTRSPPTILDPLKKIITVSVKSLSPTIKLRGSRNRPIFFDECIS